MIDPHAHLRDGEQRHKETVGHGLEVAWKAGLDAVFEMPNTVPPLLGEKSIRDRIDLADSRGLTIFHGVYAGLTSQPEQISDVVRLYGELFPRIVGLKMFAGSSTGDLYIPLEADQRLVFETLSRLGYTGVLAVHCEKESLMQHRLWDPGNPFTHCQCRPPEAELESVQDIVRLARETDFRGTLHICHITLPESVEHLRRERQKSDLKMTCGVTPHHLLLSSDSMKKQRGLLLKMNPPLRSEDSRQRLFQCLMEDWIDWIETDHAPHTMAEKMDPEGTSPSGIPGFPVYPRLLRWLRDRGMSEQTLDRITHGKIVDTFGMKIPNTHREGNYELSSEYTFDPYQDILRSGGEDQ
jgi:dihydroorotase